MDVAAVQNSPLKVQRKGLAEVELPVLARSYCLRQQSSSKSKRGNGYTGRASACDMRQYAASAGWPIGQMEKMLACHKRSRKKQSLEHLPSIPEGCQTIANGGERKKCMQGVTKAGGLPSGEARNSRPAFVPKEERDRSLRVGKATAPAGFLSISTR